MGAPVEVAGVGGIASGLLTRHAVTRPAPPHLRVPPPPTRHCTSARFRHFLAGCSIPLCFVSWRFVRLVLGSSIRRRKGYIYIALYRLEIVQKTLISGTLAFSETLISFEIVIPFNLSALSRIFDWTPNRLCGLIARNFILRMLILGNVTFGMTSVSVNIIFNSYPFDLLSIIPGS